MQEDADKGQINAAKRVAAGALAQKIAKNMSRKENLTEEKK